MDAKKYKPSVAWATIAKDVVRLTKETVDNPATYRLTVRAEDTNDLMPNDVAEGYWFTDNLGIPYLIKSVTIIDVSDEDLGLQLLWDSITNVPVVDASSVEDWNTFFDLPTYGTEFSSVVVEDNMVTLFGGSNITIKNNLFSWNDRIISVNDLSGCIVLVSAGGFDGCEIMTEISLPSCTEVQGDDSLPGIGDSYLLTRIYLPKCSTLGKYALAWNNVLTDLSLSFNTITTLLEGTFRNNPRMAGYNFPNVTFIGDSCFSVNTDATSFVFPKVTEIAPNAFAYCHNNIEIYYPLLINLEANALVDNINLTEINLPLCENIGNGAIGGLTSLTILNLPSVISLGSTTGDDSVFNTTIGTSMSLTIPSALMTNNGGNPDGDIQYLQANNVVTITTV